MDISDRALITLKDAAFDIPKARPEGPFDVFLEQVFADFHARIGDLDGRLADILKGRDDKIRGNGDAVIAAWREPAPDAALARLSAGLDLVYDELMALSRRHSSNVLRGQSWYRLAAWGARAHEHMFHSPFEKPQKSYRFSAPGVPAIYLANSVYLCWLECDQPALEKCVAARFEVDADGWDFLDLPCNHQAYLEPLDLGVPGRKFDPRTVTNSPYVADVTAELADYLTVWPLLAAVSVRKRAAVERPPEYVVPQLLMRWVAGREGLLGIRFFTSKQDPSTNSQDWAVNLALPARSVKPSGYCDFLAARTRFTPPQPLSVMEGKTLAEIADEAAVDERERRLGRVMIRWPDGRLDHYVDTVFGKMEYWLDRPEIRAVGLRAD